MKLTANQLADACAATVQNATKFVDSLNKYTTIKNINTKERVAMFLAQIAMESQRLARVEENLSYSAKRLTVVWPGRFPTIASAEPYAMNPRALANKVYGGRLGNTLPDSGWKYRGRGLKQLTGYDNYKDMSNRLGVDFTKSPELVATDTFAAQTAVEFWDKINGNSFADRGDYLGLTKAINGGTTGYEDGNDWGLDDRVELLENSRKAVATWDLSVLS